MRRRALLRFAAAAVALIAGASCLSPTIPLPPPALPNSIKASDREGFWIVSGSCVEGARVQVLNTINGRGAIFFDQERIGRYTVEIPGELCDTVDVTERYKPEGAELEQESQPATFQLAPFAAGDPGDPDDNPLCE